MTAPAGHDRGDVSLAGYLAAAASAAPLRIAVRDRSRHLTYAQLDGQSGALAAALADGGMQPGARAGIWLNKSVDAIVALYGVLRCGAVCVPIDPTAPVRRAAQVIADSQPSCLLTTADRVDALLRHDRGHLRSGLLILAGDAPPDGPPGVATVPWKTLPGADDRWRDLAPPAPGDLAYILYTSGSTGVPKGVMLTHRNARAFVGWAAAEFGLHTGDVIASHAPLHFDLSIFDVFGAAAAASTVVLVPDSLQGMGYGLVRFVDEAAVSVWYSVPTALRRMASAGNAGLLAGSRLRVVAFAGEVYHTTQLRVLRAALPERAALYNLFGPTETNVCTYHRIRDQDLADGAAAAPPIGRPCPYAKALIATGDTVMVGPDDDAAADPAGDVTGDPDGVVTGELCIAGDSVTAGYWNDPRATDLRLIRWPAAGKRYFRTGDIVHRDRDGIYTFLGRRDDMVKIKGYRVELGEIEAVLSQHPDVAEAACVAVDDSWEGPALVAFAALMPGATADEPALRHHCREFLPHYMIPREIMLVPALAYTSTGKIDRRALSSMVRAAHYE